MTRSNLLRPLPITLIALLFFIFALGVGRLIADSNKTPPLFTPAERPAAAADRRPAAAVVRETFVAVDTRILQTAAPGGLNLVLFDEINLNVAHRRTDRFPDGGYVWVGRVAGRDHSEVSFSVQGELLVGTIHLGDTLYKIQPVDGRIHAIQEMGDQPKPDGEPVVISLPPAGQTPADAAATLSDDGSFVDVLVVYTPAARTAAAGYGSINALINLAVSESNTGRSNSQVTHQLRLVHQAEISYTESGSINSDLTRLANNGDGFLDSVHTLRSQYAADVVVLIIDGATSAYCGLAYLMTNLSVSFQSLAFSVVAHDCATGYFSFGHEIGHNMGSQHDRANAGTQGIFNYSYGYQDPEGDFRTVMAYNCPGGCTRVNHWSNPNVNYQSYGPTGVNVASPSSADNHESLNNAAWTVANFRQSSSAATPTPVFTPTPTPSRTPTPTRTPTRTPSPTPSNTPLPVITQAWSGGSPITLTTSSTVLGFPAGLVDNPVILHYEALNPGSLPATPVPPLIHTKYQFRITATYASNGLPAQPQPGKTYQVTLVHSPDGRRLAKEPTLGLYFWDASQGQWVLQATSFNLDLSNDKLSASLGKFGLWAVFGEGPERMFLPVVSR